MSNDPAISTAGERRYQLALLLKNRKRGPFSIPELAAEYEIPARTVWDDLTHLRSRLRYPVQERRRSGTHFIEYWIDPAFEIPEPLQCVLPAAAPYPEEGAA